MKQVLAVLLFGFSLLVPGLSEAGNLAFPGRNSIAWPPSYPQRFKVALRPGLQQTTDGLGNSAYSPGIGLAVEFVRYQTFMFGVGYDLTRIAPSDSLGTAFVYRLAAHAGFAIQLDDPARHHLVLVARPGLAFLRSPLGGGFRPGIALGFQYEYTLNSDILLSPEFQYCLYPAFGKGDYDLGGVSLGFRVSFGR